MSLNLKGMPREEAVDESIEKINKLYTIVHKGDRNFHNEGYGRRPFATRFKNYFNDHPDLRKFTQKNNMEDLVALANKYKIRVDNLKKVRSADKKGYLESLTLIRNLDDDLLDVKSSKSKQANKNIVAVKMPSVSGMVNTSGSLSVKNRLAMMKASNTSRPSSPSAKPSTPLVNTPNPEVNDPWWYEAKSNKGTYYYTANGRTSWTKPNKVAPASGGRTRRRRNKNKKSRKH